MGTSILDESFYGVNWRPKKNSETPRSSGMNSGYQEQLKDILFAISPIYYFSKVFGLAPYRWPPVTGFKKMFDIAYTLFIFSGVLAWFIYSMIWNIRNVYAGSSYTIIVPHVFKTILSFTSVLQALLLCTTLHRRKYEFILKKVCSVDDVILKYPMERTSVYKKMKIFLIVEIFIVMLIYMVLFIYDRAIWTGSIGEPHYVLGYCVHVIGTTMNLQFIDFVLLVFHRYKTANRQLLNLFDIPDNEMEWSVLPERHSKSRHNTTLTKTGLYTGEFTRNTRSPMNDAVKTKSRPEEIFQNVKIENHIRTLSKVHSTLYDIADLVNSCYGLPMLVELTFIFGALIHSLYNSMIETFNLEDLHTFGGPTESTILFILWAVVRFSKVLAVTTACQKASNEANRTAILVQKLLLDRESHGLRLFSQQLLHYRLQFTACGFFNLDSTLIHSLVGSLTVYLVILLQFQFVAS